MDHGIAIIGCGDRGNNHAGTWSHRPDSRIISVYDPDTSRARKLASEHGAVVSVSYRDAISTDGVTIASVCTPTAFHSEITCYAAQTGKHIFCEKPLALTLDQGQAMLDAVSAAGVVFMPCFQHRDRSPFPQERVLYRDGAFGNPIRFRFTDIRSVRPKPAMHSKSLNGGVVIDMACHMTDMMRHITGEEPLSVYATGGVFGKGKPSISEVDDFAVDEANIDITFSGGHQLQLYLNWGLPEGQPGYSEQLIVGPDGMAREGSGVCEAVFGDRVQDLPGDAPGTTARISRFADAVAGTAPLDVTGEDAFIALKVSIAALRSMETGLPVDIQ